MQTSAAHFDLDVLIYATGFDAFTGAYDRLDIRGVDGRQLKDRWREGATTYFGLMVHGYPNLLMVAGPQGASGTSNFPRAIEVNVDGVTELLHHALTNGCTRLEAEQDAERYWFSEVERSYEKLLLRKGKGWFVGYNSNVAGHDGKKNRYPAYQGGGARYAKLLREMINDDHRGLDIRA